MNERIIDAQVVRPEKSEPAEPKAPLHIELEAWPAELRGRCVITEKGKTRELKLDASLLAILLGFIKTRL